MQTTTVHKKNAFFYDKTLLVTILVLAIVGLLMVASASMAISERQYDTPFHYLFRQGMYLLLGGGVAFIVTRIEMAFWEKISGLILIGSILLLVLVLIPGIGHSVNGSRRWVGFGFLSLQVSELAKLGVIFYLANYLVKYQALVRTRFVGIVKPLCVLGVIGILLLLEPDFGTTTVIMGTALAMAFLGGVRLWQFGLLLFLAAAGLGLLAVISPYRLLRLTSFLNPWGHAYGSGYQLTQSLIAFGRGGIFGVGLGGSIQKLFYLPEAHTDFLFAVLGEELGLIGMLAVVLLYIVLIIRALKIGKRAMLSEQTVSGFVAYGIGIWLSMQVFINIGVNTGLLPTKGLTLPLLSYGGSSVVVVCAALAILFRIDYESRFCGSSVSRLRKNRYVCARS